MTAPGQKARLLRQAGAKGTRSEGDACSADQWQVTLLISWSIKCLLQNFYRPRCVIQPAVCSSMLCSSSFMAVRNDYTHLKFNQMLYAAMPVLYAALRKLGPELS